jgi:DNA-directed RNA polymerase subunit RPC12/RpoP
MSDIDMYKCSECSYCLTLHRATNEWKCVKCGWIKVMVHGI